MPEIKPDVTFAKEHMRNKSDEFVEYQEPDVPQLDGEQLGEAERKAREIFNKIDFGDDMECKSE